MSAFGLLKRAVPRSLLIFILPEHHKRKKLMLFIYELECWMCGREERRTEEIRKAVDEQRLGQRLNKKILCLAILKMMLMFIVF